MTRHGRGANAADWPAIGRMLALCPSERADIWAPALGPSGEFGCDLNRHLAAERPFAQAALVNRRFAGFALASGVWP